MRALVALLVCGCGKIGFAPIGIPEAICADAARPVRYDAFGSGTAADPYVLCSAGQLFDLMTPGHAAGWSRSFVVGHDIDLAGWPVRPIGDATTAFTGVFDGRDHTIANLSYDDPARDDAGLFGRVVGWTAVIERVRLVDVDVYGFQRVGGLVGLLDAGATVTSCSSTGRVRSQVENAGGLIGRAGAEWGGPELGDPSMISASWSSASVSSTRNGNFVGGLIGTLESSGYCINCYATGTVTGSFSFVGGLIGASAGTVIASYATGDVSGMGGAVGGLVGDSYTQLFDSFALGDVTGQDGSSTGPLVGIPPSGGVVDSYSYAGATCSAPTPCNDGTVTGGSIETDRTHFYSAAFAPISAWDTRHMWAVDGSAVPQLAPERIDLDEWGDCTRHLSDAPYAGGFGSPEAPFLICTPDQLAAIAADRTGWTAYHSFALMTDLDYAGLPAVTATIGETDVPFEGFFDGMGHTISSYQLASPQRNGALFGSFRGFLRRLGMVDVNISGGSDYQGALAGELVGGTVVDCFATGSVTATGYRVGGLVGYVPGDSRIISSYFAGTVTAGAGGGGLVGQLFGDLTLIHDCFTSAAVTVTSSGGPLASSPVGANNFFDAQRPCNGCDNANGSSHPDAGAFTPGDAPLSAWDFERTWQDHAPTSFPTLRPSSPSQPP